MRKLAKKMCWVWVMALIATFSLAAPTPAATSATTVQAYKGVKITYNGKELQDPTPSYIINGTTYIPLRLLMSSFGKGVQWNAATSTVIITDVAGSTGTGMDATITALQKEISELRSSLSTLNSKVSSLEDDDYDSDSSLSNIEDDLNDYFEDAGDDYFYDDGIYTTISLSGDEDDLAYTIYLDLDDASDYDDVTELNETKLKSLMTAVKTELSSEIDGTDYEDADITGKLVDDNYSSYNVKYNGSSYTYSWDDEDEDEDEISLSDIRSDLNSTFSDAGDDYLDDSGIDTSISLSGDEDDLAFTITLYFDYASYYDEISELSTTDLENLMSDVYDEITDEIDGTEYEDADITGRTYDDDSSDYVTYNGSTYYFSWD